MIFVDVDDTLVLYTAIAKIHPYGILHGEPYEPNRKLIEWLKRQNDRIIIWSGGGKEYARQAAKELLIPESIRCMLGSKFEDFSQIKAGDTVIDDQQEYFITMKEFGVRILSPHENWDNIK